jgi:hypothetical protein
MIDPTLSLALSMYSNKGIYAVVLGSGISRSAGIPTGWEVVLDLIRKLALLQGKDCEPDPAVWYEKTFGHEPNYSILLEALAKSPSERQQLLRGYFEPSETEREQGLKMPTRAHKAIAELVGNGYIRVILTTNFDRLLEQALETVGVIPTVVSTPDAVKGTLPLMHTRCTIIKLHGDYLDIRIKNTPDELEQYDKGLNALLDRIFDEFGLIVSGWSAEWDIALRAAIERCQSRRFTTYWTVRGEAGEVAKRLINLRRGEIIKTQDADSFFRGLAEKVAALDDMDRPHPLSAKVAVAIVKRYLVDDRYRILLHDLVMEELNKLDEQVSDTHFNLSEIVTAEALKRRVERFHALTEILLAIMITGSYWGEQSHQYLWVQCLERLAHRPNTFYGSVWMRLQLYPALLLLYGGGIAALAHGKYDTLATFLTKAVARVDSKDQSLVLAANTGKVMEQSIAKQLPNMQTHKYTPLSDYLYNFLREPLKEYLPLDIRYQECFDRFEYLLALVYADLQEKIDGHIWAPIGRFGWLGRGAFSLDIPPIMGEIESEVTKESENWPLLKAGLFDRSVERFQAIKAAFDAEIINRPLG